MTIAKNRTQECMFKMSKSSCGFIQVMNKSIFNEYSNADISLSLILI